MWQNPTQMIALINEHLARRPGMEPRDVYKLLYQGVKGPEHMIASPATFHERLAAEWASLDLAGNDPAAHEPAAHEPLWESIRPDGSLLRLNLRPFKSQGGDLEELVTACLETGHRLWGTQAELQQAWEVVTATCKEHSSTGMDWDQVDGFTAWLDAHGYPPVHHSEHYRVLYRPAYRLVAAETWLPMTP